MPETTPGTVLGHEAIGTVQEVGAAVTTVAAGDRVLVSCISACGRCRFCKEARYGQCLGGGGWILGHPIDGLQAEYARTPFADNSLYKVPETLSDEQVLFLADILPTAFEVGVLAGMVTPGTWSPSSAPGRSASPPSSPHSCSRPGRIVAIDLADSRLARAAEFGADTTINNGTRGRHGADHGDDGRPRRRRRRRGCRRPADVRACRRLIRPGGHVANIGVHGHPATLHLETMWSRDVTLTMGLVDTSRSRS